MLAQDVSTREHICKKGTNQLIGGLQRLTTEESLLVSASALSNLSLASFSPLSASSLALHTSHQGTWPKQQSQHHVARLNIIVKGHSP